MSESKQEAKKHRWWLSFEAHFPLERFEYHGPWWISGEGEAPHVCCAVVATDESAAIEIIRRSYDRGKHRPAILDLRFIELRPDNWSPFNGRFQPKKWMKWPWPEEKRR